MSIFIRLQILSSIIVKNLFSELYHIEIIKYSVIIEVEILSIKVAFNQCSTYFLVAIINVVWPFHAVSTMSD